MLNPLVERLKAACNQFTAECFGTGTSTKQQNTWDTPMTRQRLNELLALAPTLPSQTRHELN